MYGREIQERGPNEASADASVLSSSGLADSFVIDDRGRPRAPRVVTRFRWPRGHLAGLVGKVYEVGGPITSHAWLG